MSENQDILAAQRDRMFRCAHCGTSMFNYPDTNMVHHCNPYPYQGNIGLCVSCGGTQAKVTVRKTVGKQFCDFADPRIAVYRARLSETDGEAFDQLSFQAQLEKAIIEGSGGVGTDTDVREILGDTFCRFFDGLIAKRIARMNSENRKQFLEKPYQKQCLFALSALEVSKEEESES